MDNRDTKKERDLKKKEKDKKSVGEDPSQHTIKQFPTPKERNQKASYESESLREFFNNKFTGLAVSYDDLFQGCKDHYESKSQWVTVSKWKILA